MTRTYRECQRHADIARKLQARRRARMLVRALRSACSLFPALFTPTEPGSGKHFRSRASW